MTLYREGAIFSWGGSILSKVESLMMIILSASLAYFSPPSAGGITMLLCSSCTETCNKNSGMDFF